MHRARYSARHVGLVHYSLKSYWYKFNCVYTSLVLALGYTTHTKYYAYLSGSVTAKSPATSILLINNGSCMWPGFLRWAYTNDILETILAGISTTRIIEAYNMHTYEGHDIVSKIVDAELAHRNTLIN